MARGTPIRQKLGILGKKLFSPKIISLIFLQVKNIKTKDFLPKFRKFLKSLRSDLSLCSDHHNVQNCMRSLRNDLVLLRPEEVHEITT